MRYQYQALYELEGLAVINIRDLGPVKYAFKLMMFSGTRVLQCANAADKVPQFLSITRVYSCFFF